MPNYTGHTIINFVAGSAACYGVYSQELMQSNELMIFGSSFMAATLLLSPDLDLNYSNPARNWGVLRVFWKPYSMFFKHRGLSHSLLFGTITRLAYITFKLCLVTYSIHLVQSFFSGSSWSHAIADSLYLTGNQISEQTGWWESYSTQIVLIFIAIFFADICHISADKIVSRLKRAMSL